MYSMYDRYRTYNMSDGCQVIYGQAIRVRMIEMIMYYSTNKKRCACTMVRIIEMFMYFCTNKKPGDILYALYEVLKYTITHNSPQLRKMIHV
jgi:hypothetical protein